MKVHLPDGYFDLVQHSFPEEYISDLLMLIKHHASLFFKQGPLKQTRYTTHHIELMDPPPIRQPMYRYSAEKKKIIQDQVQELLADGLTEASTSPWSSPIVLAKKKH